MRGQTKSRRDKWQKEEISSSYWIKLIKEVASRKPIISLWGGEPLMYENILDVIAAANEYKLKIGIITNGILLSDMAEELAKFDNIDLGMSVDGPPVIHDKARNRQGTFDALLDGVNKVNEARKKIGKAPNRISVIFFTLTPDNQYQLEETIKTAELFCPEEMCVSYLTFVTQEMIDATNKITQKELGVTFDSLNEFKADLSKYDIPHIKKLTKKMNEKNFTEKFKVHFNPILKPDDIKGYYFDTRYAMGRKTCYRPWFVAEMLSNGQMSFCPDFPDYRFGDIMAENFFQIWNGEDARKFRKLIKQSKLLPMCTRCCGLLTHQPNSILKNK